MSQRNITPEAIKGWVQRTTENAECLVYHGWPSDLWAKPYDEIISFLLKRFRETTDKQEYYLCMPYLFCDVEEKELFVPWKESQNYKSLDTGELPTHTNIAPPKKVINGVPKVPQKYPQSGIKTIRTVTTWGVAL